METAVRGDRRRAEFKASARACDGFRNRCAFCLGLKVSFLMKESCPFFNKPFYEIFYFFSEIYIFYF